MRCQIPFKWTVETFKTLPETMTRYVCINVFIIESCEPDYYWSQYHKHGLQLKFEESRWVKQALYKQNKIENNTVLWN